MTERCGKWLPVAEAHCALSAGHASHCRRAVDRSESLAAYYQANRERMRVKNAAYYETHREQIRIRKKSYYESERGRAQQAHYVEMGFGAKASARYKRRKAEEHCDNLDPRLETLLGGLIAPSKP